MQTLKQLPLFKIEKNTLWGSIAIGFTIFILLLVLFDTSYNMTRFSQVLAGGLYQGMLIFMVAAGLSIVFGLMDVLNFAQGSLLMVGAYVGFDVLSRLSIANETNALLLSIYIVALTPILFLIALSLVEKFILPRFSKNAANEHSEPATSLPLLSRITVAALLGAPLGFLLGKTIATDLSDSATTLRIAAAAILTGLVLLDAVCHTVLSFLGFVSYQLSWRFQRGLAIIFNQEPPSFEPVPFKLGQFPEDSFNQWVRAATGLVGGIILAALLNETDFVTLRFGLAAVAAIFAGALVGMVFEITLIRPTYIRPFYQIILTFGVALLVRKAIEIRYGPSTKGTLVAFLPAELQGTFPPKFLQGVFPNLETTIFNYWIFMIIMGALMMIGVQLLLMRTRIGIIIRAGVEDSEMVEALGINVRLVFTGVFTLGAAIASLGGIISAGFISIDPFMGDVFLLQAIAVVIIGGLGSYVGTALAAIMVGITRSVAAYFSRQQFNTDSLAPIAVLVLLCVVLIIKPSGLFGREQ